MFESFQTKEIIDLIVHQTNKHGRKTTNSWVDVTPDDIRLVDAIIITMGIVHIPTQKMYWSKDPLFSYGFIRQCCPRDWFLRIFRNLHFSDISYKDNQGDKLYLARDLINMYKSVFVQNYNPSRYISIDESLALWKGSRIAFAVKIPKKKARSGIQQYRMCEASTGYCVDFEYYSASEIEPYENVTIDGYDISDFNLPAKIVLHLFKPYLNFGHTLGVDSYYTDARLFEILVKHKTDVVGTFCSNRRFLPSGVRHQKLEVGALKSWFRKITLESDDPLQNDNGEKRAHIENENVKHLMCLIWQDSKTVRLLSSYHIDDQVEIPNKKLFRENPNAKKLKPRVAIEYKFVMPGVDKMDQMMSTYDPARKRLKRYYRRLYLTLLEMCYYNSYIVYCSLIHNIEPTKKVTYLQYKKKVIQLSIDRYGKKFFKTTDGGVVDMKKMENLQRKTKVFEPFRLHPGQHFPMSIGVGAKGNELWQECHFCKNQSVKTEKQQNMRRPQRTKIRCGVCNVALCVIPCFHLYHTVEDYVNYQKRQNYLETQSPMAEESDWEDIEDDE